MKFHIVGGLPRSGSTLLCNLLNQNPRFYASSTSCIPQLINVISTVWSNSPELKALLEREPKKTEERMFDCVRAFIETWYAQKGKDVIFDKSRGWGHIISILYTIFPHAKAIICIRDLRNVFASVEKQHSRIPLLDLATNPLERTQYTRADKLFSPDGMIGLPVNGVEDLIRKNPENVLFVQFEQFVENPTLWMEKIYKHIEEDYFEHDFENIENTAIDLDYGHYLGKFPHKGMGKVETSDIKEWMQWISGDIATLIMQRYPMFNQRFGYL